MPDIKAIFEKSRPVSSIIADLKKKSIVIPDWSELVKSYDQSQHKIVKDVIGRKDKHRSDGTVDKASRISLDLDKLLSRRYNEYTFSIPVKRVYSNIGDSKVRKEIVKAMEAIYKHARIDSVNLQRGLSYYASCEVFTMWYTVKSPNTLYGFNSEYKLKCKTYSPMDGVKLYPLFDEMGDMLAMSFEYVKKIDNKSVTIFETYTADRHYMWRRGTGGWNEMLMEQIEGGEVVSGDAVPIGKIPGAYLWRPLPVYYALTNIREEIEYSLSRNSDVIAYNSAPVLKVAGEMKGEEKKGEGQRVIRLENGGDVAYVSWSQANEALKYHVDTLMKMYFMLGQMPDVSFDSMKNLGNIGYDARQTLFTDAHLRIGEESGPIIEFLERECNVIKAFLKKMNVKWDKEIDNIDVEHVITPFVQNDEKYEIEKWKNANGNKPLVTHAESVEKAGLSSNPELVVEEYEAENNASLEQRMEDVFGGASAM